MSVEASIAQSHLAYVQDFRFDSGSLLSIIPSGLCCFLSYSLVRHPIRRLPRSPTILIP